MKRLLVFVATLLCLIAPVSAVYAAEYNPLGDACSTAPDASACSADPHKDPITGPNGVLKKASTLLAIMAGIAAVIIIIISGFRYITANGDTQKTTSARNTLVGAVVGLIIIAVAQSIVIFVVSKL